MLNLILLIMVAALLISMLILRYNKILATNEVDVDLFVGLGNDIIRKSNLWFPKSGLEVLEIAESIKKIVAWNRYKTGYDGVVISNSLCVKSARARSPTRVDIGDSYN